MKIVKLTAENVKRLRAVEITPDGNTVLIAGKNAQGKSSVLDSIWLALGGGPAARGTTKPIRDGQKTAQVTLDLGELIVTRSWTAAGSTLKVETAEGAQYKSPQSLLDSLVGRLSFDPLAFSKQDNRTQLASLLELVDLPFDPEELAGERADLYDQRTDVGRVGKQLEGQVAGMPKPAADAPETEVDVAALLDEHRAARTAQAEHTVWVNEAQGIGRTVERYAAEVEQLEARLEQARSTLVEHRKDLEGARAQVAAKADAVPDVDAIEKQLAEADDINRTVRAARERTELAARLGTVKAQYDDLTEQINALDQQKADAIAAATMPIEGLAFDDGGVTYRGVPFKQCSAAEQLRVSLAMAMAMNPRVRVVRITDGSLLDSDSMRLIEQMAVDQDYQVWIERVDESGQVGVVIEDGAVRASAVTG